VGKITARLELVEERAAGVFGIGDHAAFPQIDDKVQRFERDLADEVGQFIRDFNDLKDAGAPRQFQFHGRTDTAFLDAIRHGARAHFIDGAQAELFHQIPFEVEKARARVN